MSDTLATTTSVTVSDAAARRILSILSKTPSENALRISVEGGGCSGFSYAFDISRDREAQDTAIERDGATVIVDPVSLQYMAGSTIDFVNDLIGQSFKIENPLATASCGCGTSFSL